MDPDGAVTAGRSDACAGCGAVYAVLPPTCLICGQVLAPPAPPADEQRPPPRRRGRLIRVVSLLSVLAGLVTTGVGVAGVLQPRSHHAARVAAAQPNTPTVRVSTAGAAVSPTPSTSSQVAALAATAATLPPTPATSSQVTTAATLPGVVSCSNDVFGYSLQYQSPWVASSATSDQACSYFDTSPIPQASLLQASRAGLPAPAAIEITPYGRASTYTAAVIDIHNLRGINADNTIDLGIGNTYGERIMANVVTAAGTRTHLFVYLFSLRGKAFTAAAYQPYSANFDVTVRALDAMMRTLRVA